MEKHDSIRGAGSKHPPSGLQRSLGFFCPNDTHARRLKGGVGRRLSIAPYPSIRVVPPFAERRTSSFLAAKTLCSAAKPVQKGARPWGEQSLVSRAGGPGGSGSGAPA